MPYDAENRTTGSAGGSAGDPTSNLDYSSRFPSFAYRRLELADRALRISKVGIGPCALVDEERPDVISAAIESGCNVLDTAPWIRGGAHEAAIGQAVSLALRDGRVSRQDLWVSTSVGLVPELIEHSAPRVGFGRTLSVVEREFIGPGVFEWADLSRNHHCLAPKYLRHSISQSLKRTGLESFECVFIDGLDVHRRTTSPGEFSRRARAAASALEELVSQGLIRSYGIALSEPTDLDALLRVAFPAGLPPSLSSVRGPFSLLRRGLQPTLERAAQLGLHVFASGVLDGGTPRYVLPDELIEGLGDVPDAAVAIAWTQAAPHVGTALFGSSDPRHMRANLLAAHPQDIPPHLYVFEQEESK